MTSDPICPERGIPQSDCPPHCRHTLVGPDGFTRMADYVAEYVTVSPAALRAQVAEAQYNALEMARKADAAERRAEEAEFHVEQLRDARDCAERRAEELEGVLAEVKWAFDLQCPPSPRERYVDKGALYAHSWWNTVLGSILRRADLLDAARGCDHEWLDRPESDTRECLICGTEVAG